MKKTHALLTFVFGTLLVASSNRSFSQVSNQPTAGAGTLPGGINTGPGTQTTHGGMGGINLMGIPYGGGAGNPVVPPPDLNTMVSDIKPTNAVVTRRQFRGMQMAGRMLTGRVLNPMGQIVRFTYRNYVKVLSVGGDGNEDDDMLVELGPELYWDLNPPLSVNSDPAVRQSQRDGLMATITQWNQAIQEANGNMVSNSDAYRSTTDPGKQQFYGNCYQQWEARKKLLDEQLLNLQFQLCILQE